MTLYKMGWSRTIIDIPDGISVLDVGSGHNPFPRANVICDLPDSKNDQRKGKAIRYDKRFVPGDVQKLPFKDKQFDFAVCKHVLEHVPDPAKACKELMRVSKAGYIETPSKSAEVFMPKDVHLWYVYVFKGVLIFERKKIKSYFDVEYAYDHNIHNFKQKWMRSKDLTYTIFPWKGEFKFEVLTYEGVQGLQPAR